MSYIFSKKTPEVGDRGFIVGNRFIPIHTVKIPEEGLDFYFPFNESLNEIIHNIPATISGTSSFYQIKDGYLSCTKNTHNRDNYVYWSGTSSMMMYGTNDFSISFWLRAPDWNSYIGQIVLCKKRDDNTDGFVFYRDGTSDKIDFRLSMQNNFFTSEGTGNNKWHCYTVVRKDGIGYWYKDGRLDNTSVCNGNINYSQDFWIGRCDAWGNESAYFDLKALRIYNRALEMNEIKILSKEFSVS